MKKKITKAEVNKAKYKILVIRNDKIGDFMLAWPAFAMLKASINCEITALVPSYTRELAELCPYVDKVLVDPGKSADKQAHDSLIEQIKATKFDASICYFTNSYNARLVWKAKIPNRWAPATKISQFFYNHRLTQRRSRSLKPEFKYNLDLSEAFIESLGVDAVEVYPPYFQLDIKKFKEAQSVQLNIDPSNQWIMVHAGSGGSANNLSASQYAELIDDLSKKLNNAIFLLTVGPGEERLADKVKGLVSASVVLAQGYSLHDFCKLLACGDLFIAGSTGPLHIAGALDIPTVGFFPMRRSATPLRWKPLNSNKRHLAFHPPKNRAVEDMNSIEMEKVSDYVSAWYLETILP